MILAESWPRLAGLDANTSGHLDNIKMFSSEQVFFDITPKLHVSFRSVGLFVATVGTALML